jgi:uncharacterized protein
MTEEERRIITGFIERVAQGAPGPASPWGAAPGRQALPPVDPQADALIGELLAKHPEARFRLTQTAFAQEALIVEMQNRMQQLEWEAENNARQAHAAQNRGFFGMGGSRPAPMPPRPQPMVPPGHNPAMFQQNRGSGFLGTAMMTMAGVAGGILLGNAIMSMMSGGGAAEAASAGGFGQEAVPSSYTPADDAAAYQDDAGAFDDAGGFDEEI